MPLLRGTEGSAISPGRLCQYRHPGTVLHEPAEHAQRRPRLRPRHLVAYLERSIQMPKFRVRCDNPKTDFEFASLHTASKCSRSRRMAQKRLSTQTLQDIPICADRAWYG